MKTNAAALARVRQWRAIGLDTLWVRPSRLAVLPAMNVEAPHQSMTPPKLAQARLEPMVKPALKEALPPSVLPSLVWSQPDEAQMKATLQECRRCDLFDEHHRPWFGLAASQARCFLLIDAPKSSDSMMQGQAEWHADRLPMDQDHHALLSNMLAAVNLHLGQQVFVTSLIKCRQYGVVHMASPARQAARQACAPYWQTQITWLKPKVIVALGQESAQALAQVSTAGHYESIPVIELPHPAYLLRHLDDKATVWPLLLRIAACVNDAV